MSYTEQSLTDLVASIRRRVQGKDPITKEVNSSVAEPQPLESEPTKEVESVAVLHALEETKATLAHSLATIREQLADLGESLQHSTSNTDLTQRLDSGFTKLGLELEKLSRVDSVLAQLSQVREQLEQDGQSLLIIKQDLSAVQHSIQQSVETVTTEFRALKDSVAASSTHEELQKIEAEVQAQNQLIGAFPQEIQHARDELQKNLNRLLEASGSEASVRHAEVLGAIDASREQVLAGQVSLDNLQTFLQNHSESIETNFRAQTDASERLQSSVVENVLRLESGLQSLIEQVKADREAGVRELNDVFQSEAEDVRAALNKLAEDQGAQGARIREAVLNALESSQGDSASLLEKLVEQTTAIAKAQDTSRSSLQSELKGVSSQVAEFATKSTELESLFHSVLEELRAKKSVAAIEAAIAAESDSLQDYLKKNLDAQHIKLHAFIEAAFKNEREKRLEERQGEQDAAYNDTDIKLDELKAAVENELKSAKRWTLIFGSTSVFLLFSILTMVGLSLFKL